VDKGVIARLLQHQPSQILSSKEYWIPPPLIVVGESTSY